MDNCTLFGFEFSRAFDVDSAVNLVLDLEPTSEQLPLVITPNVEQIVNLHSNEKLQKYLSRAGVILPDGMPVALALRFFVHERFQRIAGSDLFPVFLERVVEREEPILFISSTDEVGLALQEAHSLVEFYTPPFFEAGGLGYQDLLGGILSKINLVKPKYVVVGISYPKREILAKDLIESMGVKECPIFLLLGAAPEFYFGHKKRAPIYIQGMGLEWLHRMLSEPRRLFGRYFYSFFMFLPILFKEAVRKR
jgi:N-acetylglucosaminyldiphosphoundecaprenol N-acetyl-beta-D-mannosaminyltransferase